MANSPLFAVNFSESGGYTYNSLVQEMPVKLKRELV